MHLGPLSTNVVASTPETVPFDEKRPDSFSFSPTLPLYGPTLIVYWPVVANAPFEGAIFEPANLTGVAGPPLEQ